MFPSIKRRLQRSSSCLRHDRCLHQRLRWLAKVRVPIPFHFPSWQSSRTGAPAPTLLASYGQMERAGKAGLPRAWRGGSVDCQGGRAGHSQNAGGSVACFRLVASTECCVLWQHRNEGRSARRPRGRLSSAMFARVNYDWATAGAGGGLNRTQWKWTIYMIKAHMRNWYEWRI